MTDTSRGELQASPETISRRSEADVQAWRRQLVRGAFRALCIVGFLALVGGSYSDYTTRGGTSIPYYVGAYVLLLLITFVPRVPYMLQAGALLFLLYGLGIFNLINSGLAGDEGIFLLAAFTLAGMFFGRQGAVPMLVLSALTLVAGGVACSTGALDTNSQAFVASNTNLFSWISTAIVFITVGSLIAFSQNVIFNRLTSSLAGSLGLTQQLETARANLERGVEERTQELARRSRYLEATAAVAREAGTTLELQALLPNVVSAVNQQFGFYHTGIFMLDPGGEWAVLTASSNPLVAQSLPDGLRLRVGEQGIVGLVARRGAAYVAADVRDDAAYVGIAALPDTRSEIALPLRARGQIIGVLDVQSEQPQAFGNQEAAVLQILADQVALAISNARLFEQAQSSLEAERRLYSKVSTEAWKKLLGAQKSLGFRRNRQGLDIAGNTWRPEMRTAVQTGKTAIDQAQSVALAAPIKVRDQVIGVINVRKRQDADQWTLEQVSVIETLADQLSVALESARLYQDTQRRAAQEQLTGAITARMRESLDLNAVLQTAVREMGLALDVDVVEVRLGTGDGISDVIRPEEVRP
ncbi:MAG: GAF domain-containing protein [Anaerolineae bacterium]|nr:GAF domain-containing protein [Anaerolineae bacterium]